VRDVNRRLAAVLWAAVAAGIVVTLSPHVTTPHLPAASGPSSPARSSGPRPASAAGGPSSAAPSGSSAPSGRATPAGSAADQTAGTYIPASEDGLLRVPVAQLTAHIGAVLPPLRHLLAADLLVVAPQTLPATALRTVLALPGVTAAELVDAARLRLNGGYVPMLGVDPAQFRAFAARPTAESTALWQNVANGAIAVSYLMGQQESLPLGGTVKVTGSATEQLRVGGFGTVGISGVDAVVSSQVAQSLGMPAGNAIVISAPHAQLSVLIQKLGVALPRDASVVPLVAQAAVRGLPVTTGSAGALGVTPADGPGLTVAQTRAFLAAAESRLGLPYVWGDAGPDAFDCSGLVQWSMRQAGIVMPRVAVDQAQTGPLIPLSDLQPGDLLFYHTDPTAPEYISHVAIYLGDGLMEQAPEPGMDVQVVPAVFGGGFAGAVQVYPRVAAAVAAEF
jgi:peptidoglycan DL-endopeptidase CwlO